MMMPTTVGLTKDDPVTRLDELAYAIDKLQTDRRDTVQGMRADGWSWREIGGVLGISKQCAHRRFGRPPG